MKLPKREKRIAAMEIEEKEKEITYQEAAMAHTYASQLPQGYPLKLLHLQSFCTDNGKPAPHHLDRI